MCSIVRPWSLATLVERGAIAAASIVRRYGIGFGIAA